MSKQEGCFCPEGKKHSGSGEKKREKKDLYDGAGTVGSKHLFSSVIGFL